MSQNPSADRALIAAAKSGSLAEAGAALARGARALAVDDQGMCAAHWAAHRGDAPTLRLVSTPESCALADATGRLPLHLACAKGESEAAATLLALAPKTIDAPDLDGRRPLHWAAEAGASALCMDLLSRGAAPDAADLSGQTAAGAARESGLTALGAAIDSSPRSRVGAWREARQAGAPPAPAAKPAP